MPLLWSVTTLRNSDVLRQTPLSTDKKGDYKEVLVNLPAELIYLIIPLPMAKRNFLNKVFFWRQLPSERLMENIPLIVFLCFLGIVYIANAHHSEKQSREIRKVEVEVQNLKREHLQVLSTLMHEKKHTRIENEVKQLGLAPPKSRPYRIVVN